VKERDEQRERERERKRGTRESIRIVLGARVVQYNLIGNNIYFIAVCCFLRTNQSNFIVVPIIITCIPPVGTYIQCVSDVL
jgi:hypothetical protein